MHFPRLTTSLLILANLLLASPLYSQILASDDFNDGVITGWTQYGPYWTESGGLFHCATTPPNTPIAAVRSDGFDWTDYSVEADVWPLGQHCASSTEILFRFQSEFPSDGFCKCSLNYCTTRDFYLACPGGVTAHVPFNWQVGQPYRLRATVAGQSATCEILGYPGTFLSADAPGMPTSGTAGLRSTHIPSNYDDFLVTSLSVCAPTGTTVITHGYQYGGSLPAWVDDMADRVVARIGGGSSKHRYLKDSGRLAPEPEAGCGERVIVFDWADDSRRLGRGWSEAAAEALFATLMMYEDVLDLGHIHLIGHSRGAVVNSEVAERLIRVAGKSVGQVTTLDPHDNGADGAFLFVDYDVNRLHEHEYALAGGLTQSGIWTWDGVGRADNYYQTGDINPADLNGRAIPGSFNLRFSGFPTGPTLSHSDVHEWYAATIPEDDPMDYPLDWFDENADQCLSSFRDYPLRRDRDGYYFSRVGGGVPCPENPSRVHPLFDFCREGIVNGDFKKQANYSGWELHGGDGDGIISQSHELKLCDLNDSFGCPLPAGGSFGSTRTHNRFWIPRQANLFKYARKNVTAHSGPAQTDAILRVVFQDARGEIEDAVFDDHIGSTEHAWIRSLIPIPEDFRGRSARVSFELIALDDVTAVTIKEVALGGNCP